MTSSPWVSCPPPSSRERRRILEQDRKSLTELLRAIGPDRDLVDVDEEITDAWPANRAYARLLQIPDIGPTRANKLLARKRPRLIPVYDQVINDYLLDGAGRYWEPLRQALRADDRALHHRLIDLRKKTGLAESVSPLRIFDVIAWMEGTGRLQPMSKPSGEGV